MISAYNLTGFTLVKIITIKSYMKTSSIKYNEIQRDWFIVDAKDATLGRLSSKIAHILRGKNKINYTPHMDMSDFIVVVNADKVKLSGNKEKNKEYWRHSGFPGGGRTNNYRTIKESNPEFIIYNSVKGMLPHNSLGSKLIKHLKVYAGEKHPHGAQEPKQLKL